MFCSSPIASMPGEHRAAAVRHERQRYAGDRHDAQAHADVLERLEAEPAGDAGRGEPAEHVVGAGRDHQRPPDHQAEQRDQDARADQAELLPRDREHEVGVLLGHEAGAGLRAVEEPLAEQPAVADRDPGLLDVVAGAARVEVGVREREEPVHLVLLQQARGHGGHGGRHRATGEQRQPAARGTGDREHAEDGGREHQHRAEVGLQQDQRRRQPGDREHPEHVAEAPARAAATYVGALGGPERHPDHDRELGELRRLDRQPAEHQPRLRAVDRRAHGQHQHEPGDRRDVDERRDDPHPPVVGGQHQHHQHQPDRDVDQLLLEVRRRVAAGEVVAVGGRRPHQHAAERRPGRARRASGPSRGGASGEGHVSRSFRAGGRMEPSFMNVGSRAGGVTPGMAARPGFTSIPSMP